MAREQKPPLRVEAPNSATENPATFFFLHGYDDDADGFSSELPACSIYIQSSIILRQ